MHLVLLLQVGHAHIVSGYKGLTAFNALDVRLSAKFDTYVRQFSEHWGLL